MSEIIYKQESYKITKQFQRFESANELCGRQYTAEEA